MPLNDLRRPYDATPIGEADVADDPLVQVARWVAEARDRFDDPTDAHAMSVATADRRGRPSVRIALLTGIDERGLVFFTNRRSRRALELRDNPCAALCLHWQSIYRQVRVSGPCREVAQPEIDAYWDARPAGARRGAWGYEQSAPIVDRPALEAVRDDLSARFPDDHDIPTPTTWTGYRVEADEIELWQGRPDRLHDRFHWVRSADGWERNRLQP